MDGNQTLNLNSTTVKECLKTASSWGHDTYYNICNGNTSTIAWGNLDYLSSILAYSAAIVGIAAFITFIVMVTRAVLDA